MLANFSERWEKFEDTQRGNQKFSIEEGQTMWWPKENRTKGQTHAIEKFEDTKGVIRTRKSKDRQDSDQKRK
jgi:hypothetical protein